MPSKSIAQQRLMGIAYALKSGHMKRADASQEVQDLADSMTLQQLKDFASTSHKGLPKVKEGVLSGFLSAGPFPRINNYAENIASSFQSTLRDRKDPLVQSFIEFIDGKETQEPQETNEDTFPGGAVPQGTPGMGNVTTPSSGEVGSGDTFGEDDSDINNRIGIMSYDDYKKWVKQWQQRKKKSQDSR